MPGCMKNAKVMVIGGSGFLGSHLLKELVLADWNVVNFSRSPTSINGVQHIQGSIVDREQLMRAMQGSEVVFHLAGKVRRDRREVKHLYQLHVEGTKNVVQSAIKSGVKKLMHLSTSGTIACAYQPFIATEATPCPYHLIMRWPYYASKLEAEAVAFEMVEGQDIELISFHPSLLLGPGDFRGSSTLDVLQVMKKQMPAIPSGGLNFVDVRDVAKTLVESIGLGRNGERYLLGSANWTLSEFIHKIGHIAEVASPKFHAPDILTWLAANLISSPFHLLKKTSPLEPVAVEMSQVFWYFDSTKAMNELNFSPRSPLETLKDTIQDLRSMGYD